MLEFLPSFSQKMSFVPGENRVFFFSMARVVNISRRAANKWEHYKDRYGFPLGDSAWISISEPGQQDTIASNPILDKYPNLKIAFWDITKPSEYINPKYAIEKEILNPPSYSDARRIVNFILKNDGRNIIVNCALGYSRSTAVCKFCEDVLGYEWVKGYKNEYWGKDWSDPNPVLYQKMVDYYNFPVLSYFSDEEFYSPLKSGVISVDSNEIIINEKGNP